MENVLEDARSNSAAEGGGAEMMMQEVPVNSPPKDSKVQQVFQSLEIDHNGGDDDNGNGDYSDNKAVLQEMAIPVHNMEAGLSLPTAEELRTTVNPVSKKNATSTARWIKLTVAVVVIFSILIGISAGVRRKNEATSATSSSVSSPARRKATVRNVVEYLSEQEVSEKDKLQMDDTPQSRAVAWLAESDELNLAIPKNDKNETEGYSYMARYIMAVNYYSLAGPAWKFDLEFLTGDDICDWKGLVLTPPAVPTQAGVTCDQITGFPISLELSSNNLRGEIPTENGLLTTLTTFDVEKNDNVRGTIPTELCNLAKLKTLILDGNEILGTVPACFEQLSQLNLLSLNSNKLTGPLPSELGNLRKLKELHINNNDFSGDPSAVFNSISDLEHILASGNSFMGFIDDKFLQHHKYLKLVDLSGNDWLLKADAGLPVHLLKLSSLQVLDLSHNRLSGHVPDFTSENTVLKFLSLSSNEMNGGLPSALMNLKALEHLDVSDNMFHGPIRHELGSMLSLQYLDLSHNGFQAGTIPKTFANLTALTEFSMRRTDRTGPLPTWIGDLDKLVLVDLGSNSFSGDIPVSYGALDDLEFLMLNHNHNITGEVPDSFSDLNKLRAFFVDGTDVTGNVQETVCDLLQFAKMDGNEVVYADCGGVDPAFACECCECCDNDEDKGCSIQFQTSLRASWTKDFTNETSFLNRDYIPPV